MDVVISAEAIKRIKDYAQEYKLEPTVRVYVEGVACKGARFGIAFDEAKQFDIMTDVDGIEVLTDTSFLTKYTDGLSIDFTEGEKAGFVIKSIKPSIEEAEPTGCGGCHSGASGGCGGCGSGSSCGQ